jgi:hypothetical protein
MLDLKINAKDMDILSKNHSKIKSCNSEKSKDFLKVLENQKDTQKKVETTNTDKKFPKEGIKVQGKNTENQVQLEELIEPIDEDKTEEDIKDELMALINLVSDIVTKLDFETDELEGLNLEPLKLEAEELASKLTQFLGEDNLSFIKEDMGKLVEGFEKLISSFEKELDKLNIFSKGKTMDLTKDKVETTLNEVKTTIKLLEDNINQLMEGDYTSFNDEEKPLDINLDIDNDKQNEEIEFEEVYDKEKTVPRESEPIVDNIDMEEIQTEEIDNNPQYLIMDKSKVVENKELTNKNLPEVDKKELIDQIVNKAKFILDDNKQEIKIKLKPEILGELMLKMEVEKGSVLAKIMVDNYRTKELIEANLYQLKQDMKENGLEIKTFEVFVGSNNDFDRENRQEFDFNQKRGKLKIKNPKLKEIETYDESIKGNILPLYEEGELNLFA